jgi:GNAT superfamily N-acetyltransferase
MGRNLTELRRTLGAAAKLWATPELHQVTDDWWVACSGRMNVNYNLACCQSSRPDALVEHCLQPLLDLGKPAIIMLAGSGLANAQRLVESGWVTVGALPLMVMDDRTPTTIDGAGARSLTDDELPLARELLIDTYGLDDGTAEAAVPGLALEREDMGVWGLFDGGRMVSCFTSIVEDGMLVVWSMATRTDCQGRGFGRQLLGSVLNDQFDKGATGSLLHSSVAGEKLYGALGYSTVEYWQLWSRPRWVIGNA